MYCWQQERTGAHFQAKKKLASQEPSREPINYSGLLTFCVGRLGMRPLDFWQMTFAEFWPLYNAATGNTIKPLTEMELDSLEDAWLGVGNGDA